MSDNRTTLQQHNIRINENNSDLSSILEEINNLPLVDVPILQDKNVVPTTETQEIVADDGYTGLSKVTVEKITGDTLEVTPGTEQQNFSGVYTDVKVAGDENLVAENIKKDVEIFGVVGSAESGNAEMMSKVPDDTSYTKIGTFLTKITDIDTSNLTNMGSFFSDCQFLREVPPLNTSNVTNMSSMFYRCYSLIEIPSIDTSNVTNMNSMFQYCNSLETIPELNAQKASSISSFLSGSRELKNLGGFIDLGKGFTTKSTNNANLAFSLTSTIVTYESLMNIINKLYDLNLTYDVANGGTLYTQQLKLNSQNLAKLTADEIAIATNKGWTVS